MKNTRQTKEQGEMLVLNTLYAEEAAKCGNATAYSMYERLVTTTIRKANQ